MAQFTFKLQTVLRQRDLLEQERQRDLAIVDAERATIAAELRRLDETVKAAVADLRQNQLVGEISLSFITAHRRFMIAMQRQGVLQMQKLNAAQAKVDQARARLAEAAKQRRIIEKLRERQYAVWSDAINRKEIAALDEVAMQMTADSIRQERTQLEAESRL